jgi:hypothetical protein
MVENLAAFTDAHEGHPGTTPPSPHPRARAEKHVVAGGSDKLVFELPIMIRCRGKLGKKCKCL